MLTRRLDRLRGFAFLCLLPLAGTAFAQQAQVLDLPSRPGVTERLLVVRPASAPDTVLVRSRDLFVRRGKLGGTRSALLTYTGGAMQGRPCEAFAHHGFNGIEDKVVGDLSAWIREH